MSLRLNIQESSIKKKRGLSFFVDKKNKEVEFNILEEDYEKSNKNNNFGNSNHITNLSFQEKTKEPVTAISDQAVKILQSNAGIYNTAKVVDFTKNKFLANINSGNTLSQKSLQKVQPEKEIVSAMVRLNNQGLNVPLKLEELKKLPLIPLTGARIYKKKMFTDLGPRNNYTPLEEQDECDSENNEANSFMQSKSKQRNIQHNNHTLDQEETVTVFDLVHRGRQRQHYFKELQKQAKQNVQVQSPKIMSPISQKNAHSLVQNMQSFQIQKGLKNSELNSSQSYLLGRKNLSLGSRQKIQKQLFLASRSRDKKQAIKEFNKEVQSAVLPEIGSSLFKQNKSKSYESNDQSRNQILMQDKSKEKKYEFIHEEYYDPKCKGKFTIFNKYAIEVQDENEMQERDLKIKEDQIIEKIKLEEQKNEGVSSSSIPEKIWIKLFEAKCMDLGIPIKQDKQQERFVTQMQLNQRDDRISLRDQGMGSQSAEVIGKFILKNNENVQKIDLSCNQLQSNFKQIVNGIKKNRRLIQLVMRNNQLSGEHSEDLIQIIKDHPSLSIIDFSNSELNVNKNKLRNTGAIAIVEGILQSKKQGFSLISEINLSNNYLTGDCLNHFARMNDLNFVRLQCLNLSYNALGPDAFKLLQPILSPIVQLNLANTKLNNQSIDDFVEMFKVQEMKVEYLDLHSNQITSDGFYKLMVCLKINNKVKSLNVSRNNIASDLKVFKMVHKFLNCNKVLEVLNLAYCDLNEKAGDMIGKGLRGNTNLQSLILKGNPIKSGISEIARSFLFNKKALCLKELDLSKCQIQCSDITDDFINMIKSKFTTLKTLSLRHNLIKYQSSQQIRDALEINKTITKLPIDYNPIKQEVSEQIEKFCQRNLEYDSINQKTKNLYELEAKSKRVKTQKQALFTEIKDLKKMTDNSIEEIQEKLTQVEQFQNSRQTSKNFFLTVLNNINSHQDLNNISYIQSSSVRNSPAQKLQNSNNSSLIRLDNQAQNQYDFKFTSQIMNGQSSHVNSPRLITQNQEPLTSLTKLTVDSVNTLGSCSSIIQHMRYRSQGPMRSEKVFMVTQLINQKIEQLSGEKDFLKFRYKIIDKECDEVKNDIIHKYLVLKKEKDIQDANLEKKEKQIEELTIKENETKKKYEKMMTDIKDRIKALQMGQETVQEQLQTVKDELKEERKQYDKYLVRDKERLVYVKEVLRTKMIVHQSFQNELSRQQGKIITNQQSKANFEEALILGKAEFERIQTLKKARQHSASNKKSNKKSASKSNSQHLKVKSRLFQSIESSRKKENKKYVNIEAQRFMENLKKQKLVDIDVKSESASRSILNSNKKYLNQENSAAKSNLASALNLSKAKENQQWHGVPSKDKIEVHPFSLNINLSNQKNVYDQIKEKSESEVSQKENTNRKAVIFKNLQFDNDSLGNIENREMSSLSHPNKIKKVVYDSQNNSVNISGIGSGIGGKMFLKNIDGLKTQQNIYQDPQLQKMMKGGDDENDPQIKQRKRIKNDKKNISVVSQSITSILKKKE